jgi:hypothetical protein
MNKFLLSVLAAASAVAAAGSALAPTAAEAHGIRLGFGVPLGSFVARPYAPDSYHQRSYNRRKVKQHNSYAAARAEREARTAESARIRAARRAEKVRAAQLARAEARAQAAKAQAELAKLNRAKQELDDKKQTTAAVETGSTTPATIETPAVAPVAAPAAQAEPAPEVKSAAVAAANTQQAEPQNSNDTPDRKDDEPTNKECKKFIPAVGVTISVGC